MWKIRSMINLENVMILVTGFGMHFIFCYIYLTLCSLWKCKKIASNYHHAISAHHREELTSTALLTTMPGWWEKLEPGPPFDILNIWSLNLTNSFVPTWNLTSQSIFKRDRTLHWNIVLEMQLIINQFNFSLLIKILKYIVMLKY